MSYANNVRAALGNMVRTPGPIKALAAAPGNGPAPAVHSPKKRIQLPVVNGTAPEFSIISIIDQWLVQQDQTIRIEVAFKFRGPRSTGVFHASECTKEQVCLREMAYGVYGAPGIRHVDDARILRIFDNGHFTHARLESYIIAAVHSVKGKAWNELSYAPDEKLRSGTADIGMILWGWPYLIEIKSIKRSGFEALGAEADPDHVGQLNQYMGISGVKAGFVLYENKDTQDLREYFVRYDHERWLANEQNVVDPVLAHVEAGTLPDKITEEDGCRMDWCQHYDYCKRRSGSKWLPTPQNIALLRERSTHEDQG